MVHQIIQDDVGGISLAATIQKHHEDTNEPVVLQSAVEEEGQLHGKNLDHVPRILNTDNTRSLLASKKHYDSVTIFS